MGSFLLMAGAKGKRYGLKYSRVMVHQPLGGAQGQATDIEIQAREILKIRELMYKIYSEATGQKISVIKNALERDNFMTADEAKDFGLIDHVIEKRPESLEITNTFKE
jgi:ATP-dependent Clp protease protease subunit